MARTVRSAEPDTAARILDVAERLVQSRGYHGFSYADVAAELGVTKPALHYHYAGKADLGVALVTRYGRRFGEALATLDAAGGSAADKLAGYVNVYLEVLRRDRMCLCGMLAAEYQTLPAAVQAAVRTFFRSNEEWLAAVLAEGGRDGSLAATMSPSEGARLIVSCLEGAMLLARSTGNVEQFEAVSANLLAGLAAAADGGVRFAAARPRRLAAR